MGIQASPGGTDDFDPAIDATEELQVSASGGAQYGPASGGVFSTVIKQGTNEFHGSIYDYLSNTILDANSYADNLDGLGRSPYVVNMPGGTLGGPIRKNKAYFFFSYAGERAYQPTPESDSLPTAAMRNGDFTGTGYTIYDPSTVTCTTETSSGCSTYGRTEFPNDTIPQSDISSIGAKIVSLYPLPTLSGIAANYPSTGNRHTNFDQYLGRLDQSISERTNLNEMFALTNVYYPADVNALSGPASTNTVLTDRDIIADADLTHTFSPSLVGDIRGSFVRYRTHTITGTALQSKYSLPGLTMPFIPTTPEQNIAPEINPSGFTEILGNTANGTVSNSWYLSPSLNQVKGRHTLSYGFVYWDIQNGVTGIPSKSNGLFDFNGQWTRENPLAAATGSGNAMADLLLGYPSSGSVVWGPNNLIDYHYYALYLQDDFKVSRKVTLNLGLRWGANTSPTERHNGINGSFCFTCTNPYTSQINYAAYPTLENPLTGGLTFAGVTAPRAPDNVNLDDWQPRFGIAWSITPKTVFRGGWGIYYAEANPSTSATGFSETSSYVDTLNGSVNPTNYFLSGTPFPSGVVQRLGAKGGYETDAGDSISYDSAGGIGAIPWTQHWSVGFQRALPERMRLDVEYVGSHSHAIDVDYPWNAFGKTGGKIQTECFQNNAICNDLVPNPFYGVLPATASLGASSTVDASQLMVPYPLFGSITEDTDPIGYSNYNSLEVQVQRQVKSLDFVANYDWMNNMYADQYLNSGSFVDSSLFYGPWVDEERGYFNTNIYWEMPVGQGGVFFRNAHGLLGGLLNHWQVSTSVVYGTGYPFEPPSANLVGGPGCTSYYSPDGETHIHWFNNNESCYKVLGDYQARTAPLEVGYLREPDFFDMNGGIQKRFALPHEGMSLMVRFQGNNITNTHDWSVPNTTSTQLPTFTTRTGWTGFGTVTGTEGSSRFMFLSAEFDF